MNVFDAPARTVGIHSVAVVGRSAASALTSESAWTVLAVFRRSLYCVSSRGSLFCLGAVALGAGPLNVLAVLPTGFAWDSAGVATGTAATCKGGALVLGDRLEFCVGNGRMWRPRHPPADWDPAVLCRNLDALAAETCRRSPTGGLASLIPGVLVGRHEAPPVSESACLVVRTAAPAIAGLEAWLAAAIPVGAAPARPTAVIAGLVGFGPGLTPSGDDLLGGTMIALRAFGWPEAADALASWLLPRARKRTNTISQAHLACAAAGEGAAALHDILTALCSPETDGLGKYLDAVEAVGHSSGWDALAGIALVVKVAAMHGPARPSGAPRGES